jgi:glycosyltransferase involved in cell wall biosynthesis
MTVPPAGHRLAGPARVAAELARGLERFGHTVRVVGSEEGSTVARLGRVGRAHAGSVPRALGPSRRLVPGADVVHVFGVRDPVGAYAALRARSTSVPYVIEPAGTVGRRPHGLRLGTVYDETFGHAIARDAGAFVVGSSHEAGEVSAAGVPRGRIHVRPPAVTPVGDLPAQGPLRDRLGIAQGPPLVLVPAPLQAQEGLEVFIAALRSLPDTVGVILGPDEQDGTRPRLERATLEEGLGARLHVLAEEPSREALARALADADCLCLPSASDGFGLVAAEGACAGLPVVLTRDAGAVEVLDPGACRVVRPGDAAALSMALGEVLWSPSIRSRARDAAASVREALDPDAIAARQLAIYETVR